MAEVDPDDDSIERWVLWHYRYDPDRRERRNVVIAAFDNEGQFFLRLEQENASLDRAKAVGEAERVERLGGVVKPPGDAAAARANRSRRGKKHRERKRPTT